MIKNNTTNNIIIYFLGGLFVCGSYFLGRWIGDQIVTYPLKKEILRNDQIIKNLELKIKADSIKIKNIRDSLTKIKP